MILKIKFIFVLLLYITSLYSFEYQKNYAEEQFYDGDFDKIVRFDELYLEDIFSEHNESKKVREIIKRIHKEMNNPDANCKISIVAYSQHLNSKEKALQKSKEYADRIYEQLLASKIDKKIIYRYFEGDSAMLYSDETKSSNALSNRVNINLYVRYISDEDNDGVYSDKDKCPDTKPNTLVDSNGCEAKNIVVLLEGDKKNTKIIVSNDAGSVVIDTIDEFTIINSKDTPPSKPQKISKEKLKKVFTNVENVPIVSLHYTFYFDDINLLENSKKELNSMLEKIAKIKNPIIMIIGHTDTVGSEKYNYQLGLKRANEIKKFILASKIKSLKIEARSYGETNLAVPTEDNIAEKRNRRVEVFIH